MRVLVVALAYLGLARVLEVAPVVSRRLAQGLADLAAVAEELRRGRLERQLSAEALEEAAELEAEELETAARERYTAARAAVLARLAELDAEEADAGSIAERTGAYSASVRSVL